MGLQATIFLQSPEDILIKELRNNKSNTFVWLIAEMTSLPKNPK